MSKKTLAAIFDETGYIRLKDEDGNLFRYKTIDYVNTFIDENKVKRQLAESLIVSFSEKRLRKDRNDRERLVETARKLLQN
ncbi:MAG: IS1634 family transposase, partial [Bacillota bacterium]